MVKDWTLTIAFKPLESSRTRRVKAWIIQRAYKWNCHYFDYRYIFFSNIPLSTGDVSNDWKIAHVMLIYEKFEHAKVVISGGKVTDNTMANKKTNKRQKKPQWQSSTKSIIILKLCFRMPVPNQGHYGFHSFPVVDWFCLFIYLWVLTFPL